MSDDPVVLTQDAPKVEAPQDNAEVSGGEKPAVDPQANANEGENEPEHKRKGGFQRRIEKLERERDQLLDALTKTAGRVPAGEPKVESTKAPEPQSRPKPEDFRIEGTDTYDSVAFQEALTDWKVDQRLEAAERQRQERETASQAKTEQQKREESHQRRIRSFAAKTPDFDEVMANAEEIPITQAMGEAILDSELGAELTYFLGQNPAEAERISKLSPVRALVEMGKIEARLAVQEPAPEVGEPAPVPQSKAPKPESPVSRPNGTRTKPDPLSAAAPFDDFEKEMNKRQFGR